MSHGHVTETQCVCVCLVKGQKCSGGGRSTFRNWLASSVIASWESSLRNLSTSQAVRPFFCWLLFQVSFVLVLPGAAASPAPSESASSVLAFVAIWNFLQPCDWTDRQGFLFVVLFVVVLFFPPKPLVICPPPVGEWGSYLFPTGKEGLCTKGETQTRPKQLISMTMRPPIFSLLTNAGTLPKLT